VLTNYPGSPGMPKPPGMAMPPVPGMSGPQAAMALAKGPPGLATAASTGMTPPPSAVHAKGAIGSEGAGPFTTQRSQVRFVGPAGAKVGWYVGGGGSDAMGRPLLIPHQLDVPGRYNFIQASIYRLKLSEIPGRPGLELYPTIEVVPANPKTEPFLSHNYIPVEFTEQDFDQVTAGNYVTKVIYLPDPLAQSPTGAGIEELISTQLEPGVDPIAEAHRRGHILLIVRLGGIDLETSNSPALGNGGPYCPPGGVGMQAPARPTMPMPTVPMARPPMGAVPAVVPSVPTSQHAPGVQPAAMMVNGPGEPPVVVMPEQRKPLFPLTTIPGRKNFLRRMWEPLTY
jgi:hypothetical protein